MPHELRASTLNNRSDPPRPCSSSSFKPLCSFASNHFSFRAHSASCWHHNAILASLVEHRAWHVYHFYFHPLYLTMIHDKLLSLSLSLSLSVFQRLLIKIILQPIHFEQTWKRSYLPFFYGKKGNKGFYFHRRLIWGTLMRFAAATS